MLGVAAGLPAAARAATEPQPVLRMAISETMLVDVNLNDARVAMQLWIKRLEQDLKITIELSPKVFDTSEDVLRRARAGHLDALAVNLLEYRQIADLLSPNDLLVGSGASGPDQYLLLVKRHGEIRQLSQLRGRKLLVLKAPKMCVASAWLSTLLDESHLGGPEEFFGPMVAEAKVSRVVLPVFFGQADACLTSKHGFDTMCELNPQVGKDLAPLATSASMVVCFYAFHKNFRSAARQRFLDVRGGMLSSPAGKQMATLFQFDELTARDASCLSNGLSTLEAAEQIRLKTTNAGRRGDR